MDYNDDFEEIIYDGLEEDIIYSEPPRNVKRPKKEKQPKERKSFKEKVGNTVDKTGKAVQNTGNVVNAAGKGVEVAGKGVEMAGKAAEVIGKGMQAAGKGVSAASNALSSAGAALSSTGVGAIAGVPLSALGKIGSGLGKGLDTAGKGTQNFGKTAQKTGKNVQNAGKNVQSTGKNINQRGKNISTAGNEFSERAKQARMHRGKSKSPISMHDSGSSGRKFTEKVGNRVKEARKDLAAFFKAVPTSFDDIKRKAKVWLILIVAGLLSSIFLVYMIFSPVLDVIQNLSEKWDSIKLGVELTENLYNGFGFDTTKEAFYHEANYLYEDYDEQLDLSLLMATLFYKEKEGYNTNYGENPTIDDNVEGIEMGSLIYSARHFLISEFKDMFEDLDEDGKNYTIGKIYRLRKLARNQLDTSVFGNGGLPTAEEEVTLSEFADRVKDRMSRDVYEAIQAAPTLLDAVNPFNYAKKVYELLKIGEGTENFSTTSFTNDNEAELAFKNLLKESMITGVEFGNLHFDFSTGQFKITIYKYEQNLDNYKNYLKDYYIPNMPEFKEDLKGLKGKKKDAAIEAIIDDIYEYASEFDEIFGYNQSKASGDYNAECIGNVSDDLVEVLKRLPVNGSNYNFISNDAYGINGGKKNNGVNLSKTSANINLGDNVYSIYSGKVIEIQKKNNCNTEDDETCDPNGNYVKIKHDSIKTSGSKYDIETFYSNMQNVKVKKGDTVKTGDIIGTVGETGNAAEPMVHFEMYDTESKKYLNPTNLFIPCERSSGLVNGTDKEKIWCYLTKNLGYSKGKAAGTMANLQHESGLISYRLQGDYSNGYETSKQYTEKVDKRKISKKEFANDKTGGGGYGLAQWTSPGRKENLYNNTINKKKSIGDLEAQLNFLSKEISDRNAWTKNYSLWNTASNNLTGVKNATSAMMTGFERPADQSTKAISGRQSTGVTIYNDMKNKQCESSNNMNNLSSNASDKRNQIIGYAITFVGHPYVYGGTKLCNNWRTESGCGVDCSSFTQAVFKKYGYNISRSTQTQKNDGKKVSEKNMKPGDIIIYKYKNGNAHVAIYLGNNKIVHAASKKTGVIIGDNYKYRPIDTIRNIIGD